MKTINGVELLQLTVKCSFQKCFELFKCFFVEQDSWEIVEGLRDSTCAILEPEKQEGYMLKKRKWPLKGWHKVCFEY